VSSLIHRRALRVRIDLSAIRHNLEVARARSGQQKLFAVVKADAYGHGASRVACALDRADGFAVVTVAEAVELRDALVTKPILVLQGARTQDECEAFEQYQLWPVVHCMDQLQWFAQLAEAGRLKPWIEIDTGMGRLGFQPDEARKVLDKNYGLNWFGAMTHFASADEAKNQHTAQQIQSFNTLTQSLNMQKSLANSAAVLAWPESTADWARPGIMLYGANPMQNQPALDASLRLAMRVTAPLVARKQYKAGDTIGYAASYVCPESMNIGYLAIGYGDGLPRVLNRHASVYLNGAECPIIGRVSMDSIAIDLSNTMCAQLGDEAVLWGEEHSIDVLAKAANTISYELMTTIKGKREYI